MEACNELDSREFYQHATSGDAKHMNPGAARVVMAKCDCTVILLLRRDNAPVDDEQSAFSRMGIN